jgi:hypothetical protein
MRLCTPRASGWIGILGQCDQGEAAASSAEGGQPGQIVLFPLTPEQMASSHSAFVMTHPGNPPRFSLAQDNVNVS